MIRFDVFGYFNTEDEKIIEVLRRNPNVEAIEEPKKKKISTKKRKWTQ